MQKETLEEMLKGIKILDILIYRARNQFKEAQERGAATDPVSCFYYGISIWNNYLKYTNSAEDIRSAVFALQKDLDKVEKAMNELSLNNKQD